MTIRVPSEILTSSDHQEEDLALKSPVIIDTGGLRVLMSLKSCLKFNKNESNSRLFWLGERQITDTIIFLLFSFISKRRASFKYGKLITQTGSDSL